MSANTAHNFNHFLYKLNISISQFEASKILEYIALSKQSCTIELILFLLGKIGLFKPTS